MKEKTAEISFESWIEDLRRDASQDGFTAAEVSMQTGKSRDQIGSMLRRMWERGEIECAGKRLAMAMDGVMRAVPVYRFVKKGKAK